MAAISVNFTFKKSPESIIFRGFTGDLFCDKMYSYKKRKCVLMIQPINAFSPRAVFRGKTESYRSPARVSDPKVAALNAGGVSAAVGALTMAVSRSYTSSWSHAGALGLCGAGLMMFFLTPGLIQKMGLGKHSNGKKTQAVTNTESQKMTAAVKEHLRPVKKMVQFRQQS